jgi:dephospho-CoA kinase
MRTDPTLVVTGAIGSGKSYVAGCFVSAGWTYVDADTIGHEVLRQDEVVAEVARLWPHTVTGGVVDRTLLATTVFSEPDSLLRLEGITHPRIWAAIDRWLADPSGPRIIEVSVLKAIDPSWGMKLVVDAPLLIRLERLVARGLSTDTAQQRIRAQPPRPKWLEAADIVIDNSRQRELALHSLLENLTR